MNKHFKYLTKISYPYWGILYFLILLFFTHFLWKLVVDGDLHSQQIAIFGKDLTAQFHSLSTFTAKITYWFVRLFPNTNDFFREDTILYFQNGGMKINIIWGCTSVKQLYIFIIIIAFYKGTWGKKLWYIPMGCVILWVYNIIRLSMISWLIYKHPERFDFLHEGLFRYVFYGLIFLLWVIWEEKIVKNTPKSPKEDLESEKHTIL
ncbi:MAG: archaeosortase/exosortase family protein [Candidatus Azobacteroides sp.]|nr:archaeosortase/exosortase family protein [Candidatus Azobacteroides sp.]